MSGFLRNRRRFCLPLHRFPACLAGWHSRQGSSISGSVPHPPSCAPFAPSPLRDSLATTGALTPAGHSPTLGPVSLIHASGRLIILSPTTLGLPPSLSHATPQRVGLLTPVSPGFASHSQARQLSGRIAFVILRTDRSPAAAPHPRLTHGCCCSRLQAGEGVPQEGFHLSDQMRFQAHGARASRPHCLAEGCCCGFSLDVASDLIPPRPSGRPKWKRLPAAGCRFHSSELDRILNLSASNRT